MKKISDKKNELQTNLDQLMIKRSKLDQKINSIKTKIEDIEKVEVRKILVELEKHNITLDDLLLKLKSDKFSLNNENQIDLADLKIIQEENQIFDKDDYKNSKH